VGGGGRSNRVGGSSVAFLSGGGVTHGWMRAWGGVMGSAFCPLVGILSLVGGAGLLVGGAGLCDSMAGAGA